MTQDKNSQQLGDLYLIPNLLGDSSPDSSLPPLIGRVVGRLSHFLVEDEKNARAFIRLMAPQLNVRVLSLERLNLQTAPADLPRLMAPLTSGISMGIISEAGCPAVADPGSNVVRRAHELGVHVKPLVGPSSMMLALMGSGLNGQRWRFVGYLPVDDGERRNAIQRLELDIARASETQIIMETPYRNQRLFEHLLAVCRPETRLCIASSLTTSAELIKVRSIAEWRKVAQAIPKSPALFLLGA